MPLKGGRVVKKRVGARVSKAKARRMGQDVGKLIGGASNPKGALAALLSGLDASVKIK